MPEDDWRRMGQERFLKGVTLVHRSYRRNPDNPDWDHDHCEFCGAKFVVDGESECLAEGYATQDDYHWVCPRCFEDFRAEFQWSLEERGE